MRELGALMRTSVRHMIQEAIPGAPPHPAADLTAGTRAIISTAADLIFLVGRSVLGPERVPTARGNAWAAVCADRERARIRADVEKVLAR